MDKDWAVLAQNLLEANRDARASVGLSNETDLSPLQIAALYDANIAHEMLAAGHECDLHSACALGLANQIARLAKTTDLSDEPDGLPPLGWALLRSQIDATNTLLACGDDPNRVLSRIGFFVWEIEALGEGEWRPIHLAVTHGYSEHARELTRSLVRGGADLDAPCMLGERPLHLASTYGWLEVMEELLDLGAHVDSRTLPCSAKVHTLASPKGELADQDLTPLMVTAREGVLNGAKLLIRRGADVNARTARRQTALHMAANAWWREEVKLVEMLLDAGANPNVEDESGRTPLDWANLKNYNQIATKLRQ